MYIATEECNFSVFERITSVTYNYMVISLGFSFSGESDPYQRINLVTPGHGKPREITIRFYYDENDISSFYMQICLSYKLVL